MIFCACLTAMDLKYIFLKSKLSSGVTDLRRKHSSLKALACAVTVLLLLWHPSDAQRP